MHRVKETFSRIFETPEKRRVDIELYEKALEEFEGDKKIKGLWAKAIALADGDEPKARSKYLNLRVEVLRDERRELTNRQIHEDISNNEDDRDEALRRYDTENETRLIRELDKATNLVGNTIGVYLVIGVFVLIVCFVALLSGARPIETLLLGIVAILPYVLIKFGVKRNAVTLRDSKNKVSLMYLITVLASVPFVLVGWIMIPILVYRWQKLNKEFGRIV